ncbi:MAG TPA: TA system VapC family ribonuclease toxin [Vicinamibacterales bacterium]|jgi:toxin-antitoxin system PIN domain toxin|nr:TA system VapC family ribonuclease toxin [Vicinamibacterales bacterium]
MVGLLDVNVLVALAWPNHIHHGVALDWFHGRARDGWATCSVTETGFVRVSSNEAVLPDARAPAEAAALLRRIVALPHHTFWKDDLRFAASPFVSLDKVIGYRQVTDAHLLGLALRHRGRLVTLDARIKALIPPDRRAEVAVHVISV